MLIRLFQCELADTNYTGAATLDDEDFDDEKAPAKIFSDHLDENNEVNLTLECA